MSPDAWCMCWPAGDNRIRNSCNQLMSMPAILNGSISRSQATVLQELQNETLWTWTSNDPFENDFNLAGLNSTSPALLPALGNITIDHAENELKWAWCYDETNQCTTGYVWPFGCLFIEVQFNVSLTRMMNRYQDWSFMNVPGVIMHCVDDNGSRRERVM